MTCLHNSGSSETLSLYDILSLSLANEEWKSVSLAIARTLIAKPHSCDVVLYVERLVSAYNLFKDDDRSLQSVCRDC